MKQPATDEALRMIYSISVKAIISRDDLDKLIVNYGNNYNAYMLIRNLAKHKYIDYPDHPLNMQVANCERMCRAIELTMNSNGVTSKGCADSRKKIFDHSVDMYFPVVADQGAVGVSKIEMNNE